MHRTNSTGKRTPVRFNRRLIRSWRKDRLRLLTSPIFGSACALAERETAAAERALVALGDNDCWGESTIVLSHRFGEGLLARITKDEARACTAFEAARAQQEKIVQAQQDYGPRYVC